MNLQGRVAVITGSSSGIGAACAIEIARAGAKVVLCGRNEDALKAVKEKCKEAGGKDDEIHYVISDVQSEDGLKIIAQSALDKFGTVHVLVNSAGGGQSDDGPVLTTKHDEGFQHHYKLMIRAPWLLIGLLVDEIVKNKGSIVNITGAGSIVAAPTHVGHFSMKAAQDYMTKCLAVELGSRGVRVNSVAPGITQTNVLAKMKSLSNEQATKIMNDAARVTQPLDNKAGEPEEVARAVVFLASDAASRITGVYLRVDGGYALSHPLYPIGQS